jgi:hypothetical protein
LDAAARPSCVGDVSGAVKAWKGNQAVGNDSEQVMLQGSLGKNQPNNGKSKGQNLVHLRDRRQAVKDGRSQLIDFDSLYHED